MKSILTKRGSSVSVDKYDAWDEAKEVWLSISLPLASISAILSKDQATELAKMLIEFAEQA